MLSKMFKSLYNTFCSFRSTPIVPKEPSLYQQSVAVFVSNLTQTNWYGKRIPELPTLPTEAVVNILEEMCHYPVLCTAIFQELADPVLFMRIFTSYSVNQLVLERCLQVATLTGRPLLPLLAINYCRWVLLERLEVGSPAYVNRIHDTMRFGSYLNDAGWNISSVNILLIAKDMIAQIKDKQSQVKLELDCLLQLLRSQGGREIEDSFRTCIDLVSLAENVIDLDVLTKIYVQLATHYHLSNHIEKSHEWAVKTMNIITDDSPEDIIIEVLQLEALYHFSKRNFDLGQMLMSQAMQRCRAYFGMTHCRYINVLQNYGQGMLLMDAYPEAVSTFYELLDVTTELHGKLSPHVPLIQGRIAFSLFLQGQNGADSFDVALQHAEEALVLAEQIIPDSSNKNRVMTELAEIRELVLSGRHESLAVEQQVKVIDVDDFKSMTLAEIRKKHRTMSRACISTLQL